MEQNEEWGDGRLVVRRAEVPDSDIVDMTVVTTRAQHLALNAIVYALVDRIREADAASISHYSLPNPTVTGADGWQGLTSEGGK
ncbi:hypothetical protein AB0893_11905 [Micromonospora aurantiaca]|uniref:hypothetical protein n=1 Tax=Micromonospora TaxID=1873 RepID=UPI00188EAEB4|nr:MULTISPECIES: hypothetical protein [unclassified Micromonospora]MBF5029299.1 hypothetical protein [Micromonospora sp. ANENR4]MCZ7425508.1 hypothetical protein [Micromonospora sp. WMMA1949]MCZ7473452.1 hypothetical protein [Micromonospora sp. WMMC273]WBC10066.1 hypothetical protein O7604_04055 [Micromonospora sp. WMMA1947]